MTKKQREYREFLETDFWKELSIAARARDRRCVRCRSKAKLQAHHVRYPSDWFDTKLGDLETLCRKCHAKEHGLAWSEPGPFMIYRDDVRFSAFIHRTICLRRKLYTGRPLRPRDRNFLKLALKVFPPTKGDSCMRFHVQQTYRVEKFMQENPDATDMTHARKPITNRP